MSNMAEYLCLCRVRWSQRGFEDHSEGFPKRSSSPLKRLPLERAGTSAERGTPPVSFGAPPDDQSMDGSPTALDYQLLAVRLALSRLRGHLPSKDNLVRMDNTATVVYINRQGGLHSRRMSQFARHLLIRSQKPLRSLRAIHIPGVFNQVADEQALPGE